MLTAQGFKRKRFDDYVAEMEQDARDLYGADVNLSANSPLAKFIQLVAYGRAEENELAENVYNSLFVDTSEGVSLEHNGKRIGISKIQAEFATTDIEFGVDAGVTVPSGVIVETSDGIGFETTESATESAGKATAKAKALETGTASNVPAGTLTTITTPTAGVNSATNPTKATNGRNRETDAEFRARYFNSLAKGGNAATASIRAALLEVSGVKDAIVDENESDTTNADGVPPNSIAPFVYGGADADIAQEILETKAGGIRSYGAVTVNVTDSAGKSHTIGFSRPTIVNINVRLTLTKNTSYPADGDAQVKTEIIKYIGGTDADGTEHDGLGLDGDVIHYKAVAAVANVNGIDDVVVELSKDGGTTYTEANIAIDKKSIARTDDLKITLQ